MVETFQDTIVEVIDTNASAKPNVPQVKIANPQQDKIFVNAIQLSFDSYFSEKGIVMIKINGEIILRPKTAGSFKRIHNFPVPLDNQEFRKNQNIEVFVWNGSGDGDTVSCGVDIQISDNPNLKVLADTPLSEVQRNNAISKPETLFDNVARSNGFDNSVLLDMKGYKKLIVLMEADPYGSGATVQVGGANVIDGDLNTEGTQISVPASGTETTIGQMDFGNIATRLPQGRISRKVGVVGILHRLRLYVSDDAVAWTQVASVDKNTSSVYTENLAGAEQSYRHMKITSQWISGDGSDIGFTCHELYDGNLFGGTMSLSFEVKNSATGQWIEYISASEIGTVSEGESVKKIIGDVIQDVTNEKFNVTLPSTQTSFRARLQITNGGLQSSVSVIRVA